MPVESVFRTQEGFIVLPCDAVTGGQGGTALYLAWLTTPTPLLTRQGREGERGE
jgi:hypothetical protein